MFIPGAAGGTLLTGYLIKRLSLTERVLVAIKSLFVLVVLSTLLIVIALIVHCKPLPFAGLTVTGDGSVCEVNK
jgi:Organic Anion Transporter Polypeptide (OATP) family